MIWRMVCRHGRKLADLVGENELNACAPATSYQTTCKPPLPLWLMARSVAMRLVAGVGTDVPRDHRVAAHAALAEVAAELIPGRGERRAGQAREIRRHQAVDAAELPGVTGIEIRHEEHAADLGGPGESHSERAAAGVFVVAGDA